MVGDREGNEVVLAAELVVSALDDAIEAACARALAKHRDARLDELLERLERIEARLPPLLVRPTEAARMLDVSLATIKRGLKSGAIPSTLVGSQRRVDVAKLHGVGAEEIAALAAGLRAA